MVYGNFSQIFHIVEKILRETPKGKTTLASTRSMGSFFFNLCLIFYITNDKCDLFFFSQHMHKYTFFFFKHDNIVLLVRGYRNILDRMK